MKIEFPIKHIEDNLIFTHDKKVWAYYKIDGFSYDFLEDKEKATPFYNQLGFLANIGLDLHFLVVPNPTDIANVLDQTIKEMKLKDYALQQNGIAYLEQVKKVLKDETDLNESSEYSHYIGVQLDKHRNKHQSTNAGINIISKFKQMVNGFNSPLYQALGLYSDDILYSEIETKKRQAEVVQKTIKKGFHSKVHKLSTTELIYVIEKGFSARSNDSDISTRSAFHMGETIEGTDKNGNVYQAIRNNKSELYDLQNTNIEELSPKTLLFSRINNANDIEELYCQYLTVHYMDDVMHHPGSEWLYDIQLRLPFPVTVSIRANHQPNEMIKKKLSNAKLEYRDQRNEALKGGQDVDMNVGLSESGTMQMENYFKQTGFPGFDCSLVFKITAESEDELNSRVIHLEDELTKKGIQFVSPYGEQVNLMLETLPGSERFQEDYSMEISPGVLAGMMFGATTNIGDNRGYYIGHTTKFSRPVFIQPDLAAKAYDIGNLFDSLAVLVAGMTGKGKSFFMNIFTYLATLTGSRGLIIDPKGDRKDWSKGLPFIPKEQIQVWTLGTNREDAGSLDPFRTSTSIEEAKDITIDILSYLTNIELSDIGYNLLSEAIEEVSEMNDPCIGEVLNCLKDMLHHFKNDDISTKRYESLENLVSTLETLKRNQLSVLLFGEKGQMYKVLKHAFPIQVLMIQNLKLPTNNEKNIRPAHKISEAIMISITAWTKQYMFNGDRNIHKFILQDEASAIERNSTGAELMDFIVRMGRYYNTTLMKGSQNASDHGQDVANMGMKFSFALRKTEEAIEMLNYFNLPETESNIKILQNLDRGQALFQDIFGRSAVIQVNPIFEEIINAFDSSTSTEDEREYERKREQLGKEKDRETVVS